MEPFRQKNNFVSPWGQDKWVSHFIPKTKNPQNSIKHNTYFLHNLEIIYLRGSIFLVHRTSSNRTLQNAPYCGWQCVWRLSLCQGSVTSVWCHSRVLWQSPDTTLMSCFYVSARLRVCSSCALSRLRALFRVGAWCSDPSTHVLSFGFVSGF